MPEELCVGEARSKNAFVAAADQSLRVLVHIDDRQEVWRQFPALLFHGKVLLVIAHDRHQNLVWQAQERWVETPLDHGRKFVEISHQFLKRSVFMDAVGSSLGVSFKFLRDLLLAASRADDDPVLLQALLVAVEVLNRPAARTEEAIAARADAVRNSG